MSQQHRRRWAEGSHFSNGLAEVAAREHARVLRVLIEHGHPDELYSVHVGAFPVATRVGAESLAVMTWLNEVQPGASITAAVAPDAVAGRRLVVQFESWAEWPL